MQDSITLEAGCRNFIRNREIGTFPILVVVFIYRIHETIRIKVRVLYKDDMIEEIIYRRCVCVCR